MAPVYDRRAEDKQMEAQLQAELDALVASEDDPSKRANLMVLNAIYRALVANTATTYEVKTDLGSLKGSFIEHVDNFTQHAKDEEALLNKGRGAWMALAWFLGVVQVAVGFMLVDVRGTIRQLEANSHQAQLMDQKLNARIDLLEARK